MDIRSIRSEPEYDAALAEVDRLFDAPPGSAEADRRDLLVILVERYEAEHYPMSTPSPIAFIEHVLESRGLNRKHLEPHFCSRSRVHEVMTRRRPLTLQMMRQIHDGLGLPLDILELPYEL